jgi:hypothetical protein
LKEIYLKKRLSIAACLLGATLLSACGGSGDGSKSHGSDTSSEVDGNNVNQDGSGLIEFPSGFPNVAFKCHGVDGVYVNGSGSQSTTVVPDDPECSPR